MSLSMSCHELLLYIEGSSRVNIFIIANLIVMITITKKEQSWNMWVYKWENERRSEALVEQRLVTLVTLRLVTRLVSVLTS